MARETAKRFTDLIVWQKAHKFVLSVYRFTSGFPKEEIYGLTSQIRRASLSIAANIVEGFKKTGAADKIRFLGWRQDVEEIMRGLDLFVLPSLNEGMGRVLVEAMAMELPVVGTTSAFQGLAVATEHGMHVADDPGEFADAVVKLLGHPERARVCGRSARQFVTSHYDWSNILQEFEQILEGVTV